MRYEIEKHLPFLPELAEASGLYETSEEVLVEPYGSGFIMKFSDGIRFIQLSESRGQIFCSAKVEHAVPSHWLPSPFAREFFNNVVEKLTAPTVAV